MRYVKATERQCDATALLQGSDDAAVRHHNALRQNQPSQTAHGRMAADTELQMEHEAEDAGARPASEDEDEETEG